MRRIERSGVRHGETAPTAVCRGGRVTALLITLSHMVVWPAAAWSQSRNAPAGDPPIQPESSEVRQIVTFLFQPSRLTEAMAIYQQQIVPIYSDVPSLLRFRGFREAESPEPLDLVVVSSYRGMSGMDNANEALRRVGSSGQSAFALYGTLSAMTQTHHDQFVEMISALSDTIRSAAALTVFEYTRVTPGSHARFETLLRTRVRPFEQVNQLVQWSETGRMLVSDGWDYLRMYGIGSLGDWHHYLRQTRTASFQQEFGALVVTRKTLLLRGDPRLSVR